MIKKLLGSSLVASMFLTGIAAAQTTTTPGVPNTGAGDLVLNVMILAVSALVAIGGTLYLYMTRRA